jgi:DNA-binding Lrp family transcriptional regulator
MGVIESVSVGTLPALDAGDRSLLTLLQDGLPLVARPYQEIAERLGSSENEVLWRLRRLQSTGVVKRTGLIVRHHEVGYGANAMLVWDVPDDQVRDVGQRLVAFDFVTLCYRRARSLPQWRYNLYCMIHGRDRETVTRHIESLNRDAGLSDYPHKVLFSRRRFKQCGARYLPSTGVSAVR